MLSSRMLCDSDPGHHAKLDSMYQYLPYIICKFVSLIIQDIDPRSCLLNLHTELHVWDPLHR